MTWRRRLGLALQALLLIAVLSLAVGNAIGQPILLSYVETGSMDPTLNPGDGFVAVPQAASGDIEEGDVIVFRAVEIQGGGLTTHRVVGETERGYITRGDANPFTDQDSGEPPVKDAQIVATALQIGGTVIEIPHLGTAAMALQGALGGAQRWLAATLGTRSLLGSQGIAFALFGLSMIAYVVDLLLDRYRPDTKARERDRSRDSGVSTRLLIAGSALVVVASATAAMVVPAGTTEFGIVSAEFTSQQPTVIPQGTTGELPYALGNGGLVPAIAYVTGTSEAVTTSPERVRLSPRSQANVTVAIDAPPETGYYRYYVAEHRYLAVLPPGLIDWLYRVHPWLPLLAIDTLIGAAVYLVGLALLPGGNTRLRRRSRDTSR